MRGTLRRFAAAGALLLAAALAGCGLRIPADPGGTLADVSGGVLRVGVSPEPGLARVSGDEPSGPLVDLVEGFADRVHARTEWSVHSEERLVELLEADEIDLAVGGFTDRTPWTDRAGVSRGYPRIPGAEGAPVVVLVQLGENEFLSELERFLDAEVGP